MTTAWSAVAQRAGVHLAGGAADWRFVVERGEDLSSTEARVHSAIISQEAARRERRDLVRAPAAPSSPTSGNIPPELAMI